MTKLPCDLRRFDIVKSNFSTVLISKRKSKGVYKIVHDRNMFDKELSALQTMDTSSNFTRVIHYDRAQNFMYIERGEVVFELFDRMVCDLGLVPYDIGSEFTSDLLSALKHLHATGLCHGDIKLENMVRSNGKFKLFDMGLSCLATDFKSRVGSMSYLPPECFADNVTVDGHKADIWSSGVCIFATWCSMRVPWNAANAAVDDKLSKRVNSYWSRLLVNFNIVEYCYRLCHYLGPSMLVAGMLKLKPSARTPADDLIKLWDVLKR
jgi:serine/threonine protein kinase